MLSKYESQNGHSELCQEYDEYEHKELRKGNKRYNVMIYLHLYYLLKKKNII